MEAFLEKFKHLKIQLEEIKSATANFDNNNVIGKGGFGEVYGGVVSHSKGHSMAAFKRLDRNYGQGDVEFWKEILMLSCYTHENLVSLLGFCDEDGEKILVYEHASHGSLDHHLSTTNLTWRQRIKICLTAAKGLCYLHDPKGTQQRVIHRDIKSSNILLDENWVAKVSDMGLSKIGPANQQHTFLATNVVGTFGYIDPVYMETYSLTKESDVYSFGVVLFEVLCGRLCFEYNNGHFQSLVQMWKRSYKQNKLDEIIFKELKQYMDPRSMETFSEIAYRCLQKSREERPKMLHVVEKLEIALEFQEIFEDAKLITEYEEMSKTTVPPLVYRSIEELKMLLSKGILVNSGKTLFSLNKNGEHCEMISSSECLIPIEVVPPEHAFYCLHKSRFSVDYYKSDEICYEFKTHVKTQFLSPNITYIVNLVFDFDYTTNDYLGLDYTLAGETKCSTSYLADGKEDGWLMAELYQFTSDTRHVELEIMFRSKKPLVVEGIKFQPLERVTHQVLENEDQVDMQTISYSDTYSEQKMTSYFEEIIKKAKHNVQWKTKKELHSILRQGFPFNKGEEWFSLARNGKKCHMLSARVTLQKEEWTWLSSPDSRFGIVAFDPLGSFQLSCRSKSLSSNTTYACYLVYKLQEDHSGFEPPIKVSDEVYCMNAWYIYLSSPQIPVIRGKVYHKTSNPLNRPKEKGLPQKRNDGWMEVQLWKFQTDTTRDSVVKDLRLTFYDNTKFVIVGLNVQGIEFRPI